MRQEHTVEPADLEVGFAELGDRYLVTNVILALPLLAVYLAEGRADCCLEREASETLHSDWS